MDTLQLNWNNSHSYSWFDAIKDSVGLGSIQLVLLVVILVFAIFYSWSKLETSEYFLDEEGNSRFDFKETVFSIGSLSITRGLIVPLALSSALILICIITLSTTITNTHKAGLDREFRTAVSEEAEKHGVFINPIDIPSYDEESSNGQVSKSNNPNTGRLCLIENHSASDKIEKGEVFDFTVKCDGTQMVF